MNDDKQLEMLMNLIVYSGNGKSEAYDAIELAKEGQFDLAEEKLKDASREIIQAHHVQTDMLTQEAKGNHAAITLLAVHSQDHLMTSMTFLDLAREIVELYRLVLAKAV